MTKTVLIDCDGVLTDNKVHYDGKGNRTKSFHTRDIRAIRQLISHGYEVYILTQSSWPGINDYAKRTGAVIIVDREKKVDQFDNYIAVGDDTPDIAMLTKASRAFCPSDADQEIKAINGITLLSCKGGEGCIAEIISIISA